MFHLKKFFGTSPKLGHLKVFGCDVYFHVPKQKRRKLDPKAKRGVFVGYASKDLEIRDPKIRDLVSGPVV